MGKGIREHIYRADQCYARKRKGEMPEGENGALMFNAMTQRRQGRNLSVNAVPQKDGAGQNWDKAQRLTLTAVAQREEEVRACAALQTGKSEEFG